ncbi:unnamed protein product [Urochloa decumbens]|uniref:WRKY domain-containing protein n=1 Tax=Urochloa decumbens TaxID=240449 RepID=A0ABC9B5K5_9POAL
MKRAMSAPGFAALEILAKGRESAEALNSMLDQQQLPEVSTMPHELRGLVEQILHCCDRALAALSGGTGGGTCKKRNPEHGSPVDLPCTTRSKRLRARGGERGIQVQKKWTTEDGFAWRKYGQKNIHGSKQPRLYFHCSYKDDSGCMARRQVQQSEASSSVYVITYFGEHTCGVDATAIGHDEKMEQFVINFGSGTMVAQQSGSPWSSCDDDGLVVNRETPDLCNSPKDEEELQEGMVAAELIEQSTRVLELMSMSSPWSEHLGRCQEWEVGHSKSLFDIDEFIDIDSLLQ